jgi:methylamine dehydrogenase accessory protein MauD
VSVFLLLVRVALAAMFALAAVSKATAPSATRATLGEFGVPQRLARPFAWLLPASEALIAVALLVTPSARLGGVAAAALLALFTVGVGVNLARGRRPECNCFGAVHSAPIGPTTLARNAVLVGVGVLVAVAGPGAGAFAWLRRLSTADLALTVAVVLLAAGLAAVSALALALFRRHGALLLRIDALEALTPRPAPAAPGLAVGAPAPEFHLPGLDGETMTLSALRSHGRPVLLLFTDPSCGPCNAMLPEIGAWQQQHATTLAIALIIRGDPEANRPKAKEHGLVNVLVQADNEVADAYAVTATPAGLLVSVDGNVESPASLGADAIRTLVQSAAERPPGLGEAAPSFVLPTLESGDVHLDDYRGRSVLLVFWNAACSFCAAMADDVRHLEGELAPLELLFVAAGDAELNRTFGFASPVAVDRDSTVASGFGVRGTPMGVLVDADGTIASGVAIGADEVLGLARRSRDLVTQTSS